MNMVSGGSELEIDENGDVYAIVDNSIRVVRADGRRETLLTWQGCPVQGWASCSTDAESLVYHRGSRRLYWSHVHDGFKFGLLSIDPRAPSSASTLHATNLITDIVAVSGLSTRPGWVSGGDGKLYMYQRGVPSDRTGAVFELGPVQGTDGGHIHAFLPDGRISESRESMTKFLVRKFEYDGSARLSGVVDRNGKRVTIQRDAQGRMQSITSPYGEVTGIGYDAQGRIATFTDPDGGGSSATYEGTSQLMSTFTNRAGVTASFGYDSRGRLVVDHDGTGFVALSRLDANTMLKSNPTRVEWQQPGNPARWSGRERGARGCIADGEISRRPRRRSEATLRHTTGGHAVAIWAGPGDVLSPVALEGARARTSQPLPMQPRVMASRYARELTTGSR